MGRHTAETGSVRAPRQGETPLVNGERRAALNRTRTADTSVNRANPLDTRSAAAVAPAAPRQSVGIAPVSVAANRTSDTATLVDTAALADVARAVPSTPADPRIVKQRRARAPKPASSELRGVNAFVRRRATIPALSFIAVSGFVVGSIVNPLQANAATAVAVVAPAKAPAPQQYTAHGTYADYDVARDSYGVTKPKPVVTPKPEATDDAAATDDSSSDDASTDSGVGTAPAAGTPDPGSAKAIALQMVQDRGWGTDQYNCLVSLWNKESGWNVYAYNPSGAYGIPQALPGSKMATVGADWQSNPATQITWGLNYISGVYGTPCGAWGHSQANNWY